MLALLACLASVALVRLLASERAGRWATDIPNDRSLHVHPTSRLGGLGVMIVTLGAWIIAAPTTLPLVATLATILTAIFLIDDVSSLTVPARLLAQAAAAVAFVVWFPLSVPMPLMPLIVLGIIWSANLYNFMDGSNGLSGGMAVIGFGAYSLAAAAAGDVGLACVSSLIAAAAAGFLVWNFHPARIFLGDAGSITLGFLAAALGLAGWQAGDWPFWFPLLVFSFFVVDSGLTLAKRLLHGEPPWKAHKSHYYQRLVRMGWTHRRLAISAYILMTATAGTAIAIRASPISAVVMALALWAIVYGVLIVVIDRAWRQSDVRRDALAARADI